MRIARAGEPGLRTPALPALAGVGRELQGGRRVHPTVLGMSVGCRWWSRCCWGWWRGPGGRRWPCGGCWVPWRCSSLCSAVLVTDAVRVEVDWSDATAASARNAGLAVGLLVVLGGSGWWSTSRVWPLARLGARRAPSAACRGDGGRRRRGGCVLEVLRTGFARGRRQLFRPRDRQGMGCAESPYR